MVVLMNRHVGFIPLGFDSMLALASWRQSLPGAAKCGSRTKSKTQKVVCGFIDGNYRVGKATRDMGKRSIGKWVEYGRRMEWSSRWLVLHILRRLAFPFWRAVIETPK
jgi:hypothetical protein